MKMKGQLLSFDALLSLMVIVMVVGVMLNTNEMIKSEITGLIEWYERNNAASNMLDVITKTPGYPENWETDINSTYVVGLRSVKFPSTLDYNKVNALFESLLDSNPQVISALVNLSNGFDFQLATYLTTVSISGNISVSTLSSVSVGTIPFSGTLYIYTPSPIPGIPYRGGAILANYTNPVLPTNTAGWYWLYLTSGQTFMFQLYANATIYNGTTYVPVPAGTTVTIEITSGTLVIRSRYLPVLDVWQIRIPANRAWWANTATGTVIIGNNTGTSQIIITSNISVNYTYATQATTALYSLAVINGTVVEDPTIIEASKEMSPWVSYTERVVPVFDYTYSRSYNLTASDVPRGVYSGVIEQQIPPYALLEVSLDGVGNTTIIAWSAGSDSITTAMLFVYKNSTTANVIAMLNVTITSGDTESSMAYTFVGNKTSVLIPWVYLFPISEPGSPVTVYVWVYQIRGLNSIALYDAGNIDLILQPKRTLMVLKLWVWDDR